MAEHNTDKPNWRYGIWDRQREEWAVRDQCESRVDDLMDSLYDSYRFEKRKWG